MLLFCCTEKVFPREGLHSSCALHFLCYIHLVLGLGLQTLGLFPAGHLAGAERPCPNKNLPYLELCPHSTAAAPGQPNFSLNAAP